MLLLLLAGATAARGAEAPTDLTELDLEALMGLEVTSVSRRGERLMTAPAAVSVITGEDLRRSGHASLAEALRLVPGLHVGHVNANIWAVSARGFTGRFSNKLLVLMDGRSVYTPLFSGVFWDVQDAFLPDLDRIEVIRGPGATLWGANAVNGVINVISKSAKETQGGIFYGGGGLEERAFGGWRWGDRIDDHTFYRVYVKAFGRDGGATTGGVDGADSWDSVRGGFRLDRETSASDHLTLQGDVYTGHSGQATMLPSLAAPPGALDVRRERVAGGNLLARWTRVLGPDSEISVQAYLDRTERDNPILPEIRSTFDIEMQHQFSPARRHNVVWGASYRWTRDEAIDTFAASIEPNGRADHLFGAFVQDEITLLPNRLMLTLGSKLEHNDYSGFEIQPGARLVWTPSSRVAAWAAWARAVRTPSRFESDGRLNAAVFSVGGMPGIGSLFGNTRLDSESLNAYEAGLRAQITDRISVDAAGFASIYRDIIGIEPGSPFVEAAPLPPHLVSPSTFQNSLRGEIYGAEVSGTIQVADHWRLVGSYSFLDVQLHRAAGSMAGEGDERNAPHNQVQIRSILDLPKGWEFDVGLSYVDSVGTGGIPSYFRLDARVGWSPDDRIRLDLGIQNAFNDSHLEAVDELTTFSGGGLGVLGTRVQTSAYFRFVYRF